jgi:hypothetical protein
VCVIEVEENGERTAVSTDSDCQWFQHLLPHQAVIGLGNSGEQMGGTTVMCERSLRPVYPDRLWAGGPTPKKKKRQNRRKNKRKTNEKKEKENRVSLVSTLS